MSKNGYAVLERDLTKDEVARIRKVMANDAVIQRAVPHRKGLMPFNKLASKVRLDRTFLDRIEEAQELALKRYKKKAPAG